MAERKRSNDGTRETDAYLDDAPTPSQQGRAEGELERRVGTRDEGKRATSSRPGATRVTKEDEQGEGNLGGLHGTGEGARHRDVRGPYDSEMPATLAAETWVLVADSEKALFLRNVTDAEAPHLVVVGKKTQENPSDRAQGANNPGRMEDTGVQQRSSLDDTDWHELAKDRFAADLAERLYAYAHDGAFRRIVLVADPRVLGALRKDLHKEVESRVVAEIDSNLTHLPVDEIEAHVSRALAEA
jgi:protein required for attachment to host cells